MSFQRCSDMLFPWRLFKYDNMVVSEFQLLLPPDGLILYREKPMDVGFQTHHAFLALLLNISLRLILNISVLCNLNQFDPQFQLTCLWRPSFLRFVAVLICFIFSIIAAFKPLRKEKKRTQHIKAAWYWRYSDPDTVDGRNPAGMVKTL